MVGAHAQYGRRWTRWRWWYSSVATARGAGARTTSRRVLKACRAYAGGIRLTGNIPGGSGSCSRRARRARGLVARIRRPQAAARVRVTVAHGDPRPVRPRRRRGRSRARPEQPDVVLHRRGITAGESSSAEPRRRRLYELSGAQTLVRLPRDNGRCVELPRSHHPSRRRHAAVTSTAGTAATAPPVGDSGIAEPNCIVAGQATALAPGWRVVPGRLNSPRAAKLIAFTSSLP